jgi:uncharacterized protein (UPF0332 family)
MSVTPGDLLTEAQALSADINHSESRRRTVIGRAYYAAFHALRTAAERQGYRYSRDNGFARSSHENLIEWAIHHGDAKSLVQGAVALRRLKNQRTTADYRLDDAVSLGDARMSLTKAVHLIAALPAA